MVINGEYILTEEDIRNQKMRALYAHNEAKEKLELLIARAHTFGRKVTKLASLLRDIRMETATPLTSEAELLALPQMDYEEALNLATIKALANSIALARKDLAEAAEVRRMSGI